MHPTELQQLTLTRVPTLRAANDAPGVCPVVRRSRSPAPSAPGFKRATNLIRTHYAGEIRAGRSMRPVEARAMRRWFKALTLSACLRRFLRNGGHYVLISGGVHHG